MDARSTYATIFFEGSEHQEKRFHLVIASNPAQLVPSEAVYFGNLSDLWLTFLERLQKHQDNFLQIDFNILRESIEAGRIYYLMLAVEQAQQKSGEIKTTLNEHYVTVLSSREVFYDSLNILSSNFFQTFVRKNPKFQDTSERKKIIKTIYESKFKQAPKDLLNRYLWLVLTFVIKVLRENPSINKVQFFDIIYLKAILAFSLAHPTLESVLCSKLVINESKWAALLKREGFLEFVSLMDKMSIEEKVVEIQKLEKQ